MPAFAFSRTSVDRSVARMSIRHPATCARDLLQAHRQRIRLLAGRGGGTPDPDSALAGARREQRRNDGVAKMLERKLVAEEERLVGHHRFDDLDDERLRIRSLEPLHQLRQAGEPGLARDRQQPAFDQVLLVGGEHQPGSLLHELAQIIVVERASRTISPKTDERSSAQSDRAAAPRSKVRRARPSPACPRPRWFPRPAR